MHLARSPRFDNLDHIRREITFVRGLIEALLADPRNTYKNWSIDQSQIGFRFTEKGRSTSEIGLIGIWNMYGLMIRRCLFSVDSFEGDLMMFGGSHSRTVYICNDPKKIDYSTQNSNQIMITFAVSVTKDMHDVSITVAITGRELQRFFWTVHP